MEIEYWCEQPGHYRKRRVEQAVSPHSQYLDLEAQSKVTCADGAVARETRPLHPTPAQHPIASDTSPRHPANSTRLPGEPHG